MQMFLKELVEFDPLDEFWKALNSPRDGHEWLDEEDVDKILTGRISPRGDHDWLTVSDVSHRLAKRFRNKLPDEVRTVASKVLCGPEWRISIDEFIGEVNNIIARLH